MITFLDFLRDCTLYWIAFDSQILSYSFCILLSICTLYMLNLQWYTMYNVFFVFFLCNMNLNFLIGYFVHIFICKNVLCFFPVFVLSIKMFSVFFSVVLSVNFFFSLLFFKKNINKSCQLSSNIRHVRLPLFSWFPLFGFWFSSLFSLHFICV